nr:MAG TPA: hypothetical protein [Bacteriophage sp.]DAK73993.1 MAG TPA: hypothetical protein [Caudoviricetes sp.]DAS42451.1 MAG TPA: hypothetical protein [Caudoviricetes sp.]
MLCTTIQIHIRYNSLDCSRLLKTALCHHRD